MLVDGLDGIIDHMPNYRRAQVSGGTFFFTLVTFDRHPFLAGDLARDCLHRAITRTGKDHPFALDAMVLLPDHLHAVWTLPDGDADFSTRWRLIKARFTRAFLEGGGGAAGLPSRPTREARGERAVWQQRFYEHAIRDENDLIRHLDYIHYNPVKHGLAACPHAWPYSTFHRFVGQDKYSLDWGCCCEGRLPTPIDWTWGGGHDLE